MPTEPELHYHLSLMEVTHSFGVTQQTIMEIVEEGIIPQPQGKPESWQFNNNDLTKIKMTLNLYRDLGINLAGAAMVLELLDHIESLMKK